MWAFLWDANAQTVFFLRVLSRTYFLGGQNTTPDRNHDEPRLRVSFLYHFLGGRRRDGRNKRRNGKGMVYMVNGCGYGFYGTPELSLALIDDDHACRFCTHETRFSTTKRIDVDYGHDLTGWGRGELAVGGGNGGGCI